MIQFSEVSFQFQKGSINRVLDILDIDSCKRHGVSAVLRNFRNEEVQWELSEGK